MNFSIRNLLTRFQVYELTGLKEQEVHLGILKGTFPKPDYLLFGDQSRWKRSTIRRWKAQQLLNPMVFNHTQVTNAT